MDYENAAKYRDQINSLNIILENKKNSIFQYN